MMHDAYHLHYQEKQHIFLGPEATKHYADFNNPLQRLSKVERNLWQMPMRCTEIVNNGQGRRTEPSCQLPLLLTYLLLQDQFDVTCPICDVMRPAAEMGR